MTNFEKLFNKELKNPEFRREFMKARIERLLTDSLNEIKNKPKKNIPKKDIIYFINNLEKNISKQVEI